MSKNNTHIRHRQNLLDIAIQTTGGLDALFEIAMDNGISISQQLAPGTELKIKQPAANAVVLNYYNRNKILPATAGSENILLLENGSAILTENESNILIN